MGSISSPLIRDGHQRGLTSKGTGGHQKGRASKGSGMKRSFGHQKGRASIGTDIKRDWHQWGRASKGTADINWAGHQSGLASIGPPWHQSGRASMRSASIGSASIGWHQTGVVHSLYVQASFSCGVITRQLPFWCRGLLVCWVLLQRCLSQKDELVCDFLSLVALNGRELTALRGKTQWSSSRMFSTVVYETQKFSLLMCLMGKV